MNNIIIKASLIGLVISHIVGKTWIRSSTITADWILGNLLDALARPALPMLLTAAGVIAKDKWKGDSRAFFRDRVSELMPFIGALVVYLIIWQRYDGYPFDFEITGILYTFGYPFYWVPMIAIWWMLSPFFMYLHSTQRGRWALMAFFGFWLGFTVLLTAPYAYMQWDMVNLSKWSANLANNHLLFKLSGFFIGGLCADVWSGALTEHPSLRKLNKIALLLSFCVTLCIPLVERGIGLDPFDHTLRDYIRPHIVIFTVTIYLEFVSRLKKGMQDFLHFFPYEVVLGLYLIHGYLIEAFVNWVPETPVVGLIVKTVTIIAMGAAFGFVYKKWHEALCSRVW
jgi:hypothetical protein